MKEPLKPDEVLARFILDIRYNNVPEGQEERDLAVAEALDRLGNIVDDANRNGTITDDLCVCLESYVYQGARINWKPDSHWDEHPDYPAACWRAEVADQATRLSYIDWVNNEIQNKEDFPEPD